MVYFVRCARCKEAVKITKIKKKFVNSKKDFLFRLIKCGKCRCVIGEYGTDGKFNPWYGAGIERL